MFKTIARKFESPTDAVSLLEADHRRVEALFDEFESADRNGKLEKAREICTELDIHARAEELAFYPRVKRVAALREDVNEGIVEHDAVKRLAAEIRRIQPGDEFFEPKMRALKEFVKHHVREEETLIFPKLVESNLDLKALGDEILAAKQRLRKRAAPTTGRAAPKTRVRGKIAAGGRSAGHRTHARARTGGAKTRVRARQP